MLNNQRVYIYILDGKIWGWVKTLVLGEHQNSWDLWMFIPLKMYIYIGIDPYTYGKSMEKLRHISPKLGEFLCFCEKLVGFTTL